MKIGFELQNSEFRVQNPRPTISVLLVELLTFWNWEEWRNLMINDCNAVINTVPYHLIKLLFNQAVLLVHRLQNVQQLVCFSVWTPITYQSSIRPATINHSASSMCCLRPDGQLEVISDKAEARDADEQNLYFTVITLAEWRRWQFGF